MLYITLHYNYAHFKCSTLHFLQYLLVFLRNSQHLQHLLEHSVVQKRNVQTMYLSSCLIKFIETKLNSQDTSNIKRINNCKNVSSLNKIAYQDTFLNFSPYQFEISRNQTTKISAREFSQRIKSCLLKQVAREFYVACLRGY